MTSRLGEETKPFDEDKFLFLKFLDQSLDSIIEKEFINTSDPKEILFLYDGFVNLLKTCKDYLGKFNNVFNLLPEKYSLMKKQVEYFNKDFKGLFSLIKPDIDRIRKDYLREEMSLGNIPRRKTASRRRVTRKTTKSQYAKSRKTTKKTSSPKRKTTSASPKRKLRK